MSISSIPKARIVELISRLKAEKQAEDYFHITSSASLDERLMMMRKTDLLAFVSGLGPDAEDELSALEDSFPFTRPPTFYLSIIDEKPDFDQINMISKGLESSQRDAGMDFDERSPVRFVYMPKKGKVSKILDTHILELMLHYERKVEINECDPDADNYGGAVHIYSLETAYMWLPEGNFHHAVLGCCDFTAIKPIYKYLKARLELDLSPPWLSSEVFGKITSGAEPRSATFSHMHYEKEMNDIQHITLTDPKLKEKGLFNTTIESPNREQTSGFYFNHPGLQFAGLGVARREGKVWTPKRLDRKMIAGLALTLIVQTEAELAKSTNLQDLIKYYHFHRVKINQKLLIGQAKEAWLELVPLVFEAVEAKKHESVLPAGLLEKMVAHQNELGLFSALEYTCPACGITWLAACPHCKKPLRARYKDEIVGRCDSCGFLDPDELVCECGEAIHITHLAAMTRLLPSDEIISSIARTAVRLNRIFTGYWIIQGRGLKYLPPRRLNMPPVLHLQDFQSWAPILKLNPAACGPLPTARVEKILSSTKEKCRRNGQPTSKSRCTNCLSKPLDPDLIRSGKTCLLRLFGVPIGKEFDGIHHGNEIADLLYKDVWIDKGQEVTIGMHVKSSRSDPPPEGMGRSTRQIKELYTQILYSASRALAGEYPIQVIGAAIPSAIHPQVIAAWSSTLNSMGFPMLIVEQEDWLKIINRAYEQSEFDKP
ncbi:MAG: hypothetical protein EHM41_15340 [Chloroflexi bacterium]|nr:MAG: hypothetical protein EHM41_15340 [Chloroflexota bacterium]